jgi:hypothetical protein
MTYAELFRNHWTGPIPFGYHPSHPTTPLPMNTYYPADHYWKAYPLPTRPVSVADLFAQPLPSYVILTDLF